MKQVTIFFILTSAISFGQIRATLQDSIPLVAESFIGIDNFQNLYYTTENVFYKKSKDTILNFIQPNLGRISSIDISNPLKIILFYEFANTMVVLDQRLNPIETISFQPSIIETLCNATTSEIWRFDAIENTLQKYNYRNERVLLSSNLQGNGIPSKLKSNLNDLWILTSTGNLLEYDYILNLKNQISNKNIQDFSPTKNGIVCLIDNELHWISSSSNLQKIDIAIEGISSFYLRENHLYIFNGMQLKHFLLFEK